MRNGHASRPKNKRRSGLLSVWSAFALATVGLCAAVAIDRSLVSMTWSQTRVCADAAALAGCRELLTDDVLRTDRDVDDRDTLAQRCRNKAVDLAHQYSRNSYGTGRAIPILNDDYVDVLKRVWNEEEGRHLAIFDSFEPDTVRVRLSNRNSENGSGRTVNPGLFGISRAVISCEATARTHDRISGFRAGPGMAILIAPFAIPEHSKQRIAGTWSSTDDQCSPDQYSWDEESNEIRQQSDGLAELALTILRTGTQVVPGQLVPIAICKSSQANPFAFQMKHGLQHADTSAAGIELLSFPRAHHSSEPDETDFDALADVWYGLIGEKRIFPLADLAAHASDAGLSDVVAARILDVTRDSDDQLQVLLQPTVMSPSSAVICRDESVPANRYIRKIALLR
jgi:hypothetical protein